MSGSGRRAADRLVFNAQLKYESVGRSRRIIELDLEDARGRRLLARLHVWPIDPQVCRTIARLDFRSDPADELIAATSLVHEAPLVTRDARLRASKVVPLAR